MSRTADDLPTLPCGCPQFPTDHVYLSWCEGRGEKHQWSHWHTNPIDALREDRFCFACGGMETQRIGSPT